MSELIHLKSVSDVADLLAMPKPTHPLISIYPHPPGLEYDYGDTRITSDMYTISLKHGIEGEFGYGRNTYDFREGTLTFMAPGQVMIPGKGSIPKDSENWNIYFHPDLIYGSPLGANIDEYSFFDYDTAEALHISDEERLTLTELVWKIKKEIENTIDKHSQKLIVSNLELILDYCLRYYDRQFYTRSNFHQDLVARFEKLLKDYFKKEMQLDKGLPTVKYCGEALGISPNYLSDLLKKETDRSAQDHIHAFVVDKAKHLLLSSDDSVKQVAYHLGFDYSQHFSKLFKAKTGMSPMEFRTLN